MTTIETGGYTDFQNNPYQRTKKVIPTKTQGGNSALWYNPGVGGAGYIHLLWITKLAVNKAFAITLTIDISHSYLLFSVAYAQVRYFFTGKI